MGLCLPGPDGCHTRSFDTEDTFVGPSWPGPDYPLGRHPYLGHMLASNKKNKNQLKNLLELWQVGSPTFPSHRAAVESGLQLLNSDTKHEFNMSAGEFMNILERIFVMLFLILCQKQLKDSTYSGHICFKLHYRVDTS